MHNKFSPFNFDVPRCANYPQNKLYTSSGQDLFQGSFGKRQAKINVIKDVDARKKYTA